ncbi:MAG: PIG-L family deacetylase [Kiritimatiellae bacterium]|nr:PIG-L family deacetylase [Kiritimatiellia bacterium]
MSAGSYRVFAVAAHPDDIEFGMAGTLLLLREAGCELHYMTVANGCCGSNVTDAAETARIRGGEARAAAASLGAVYHAPLVNDQEILYSKALLDRLTAIVREVAPDILLVPSLFDYMEDHTQTARLAVMAAFCRGMPNLSGDPPRPIVENPVRVYHAQPHGHRDAMGQFRTPEFLIGIDSVLQPKTEALACHHSQRAWLDDSQGMDAYLATMHQFCAEMGSLSGGCFAHAEGWSRHNHLGFCDAAFDPLVQTLNALACPVAQG